VHLFDKNFREIDQFCTFNSRADLLAWYVDGFRFCEEQSVNADDLLPFLLTNEPSPTRPQSSMQANCMGSSLKRSRQSLLSLKDERQKQLCKYKMQELDES
jgi:hypothetical protein